MTLAQLANFIRIADLQSLTKAAAAVRIAQPALSRQVRQLEQELAAPLVIRHARGVTLTPAGEVLLARARRLMQDVEAAKDAVQSLAANPTGRVSLGVPVSLSGALLPPLLTNLRAKYPGLRPFFVEGFSATLHARMLAGELDLAVLYEDRAIGPLATSPLVEERLQLIGSARGDQRETRGWRQMAGELLIVPARPNRLRLIIDNALEALPSPHPDILEVDSLHAIIAMVTEGSGFTILPYSAVAAEVESGALRRWPLPAVPFTRTLLSARPADRESSSAVAAVEHEIHQLARILAPSLEWKALSVEA